MEPTYCEVEILDIEADFDARMTDEKPDKTGKGFTQMKRIVSCIFGLFLVCCGATLPPPTNLAVLIALSSPTPILVSEFEPKKSAKKKGARAK